MEQDAASSVVATRTRATRAPTTRTETRVAFDSDAALSTDQTSNESPDDEGTETQRADFHGDGAKSEQREPRRRGD